MQAKAKIKVVKLNAWLYRVESEFGNHLGTISKNLPGKYEDDPRYEARFQDILGCTIKKHFRSFQQAKNWFRS